MRYLLCFIFPPLAVLLVKKPITALLNLLLTLLFVLPGVIHALIVVYNYKSDKRNDRLIKALNARDAASQKR